MRLQDKQPIVAEERHVSVEVPNVNKAGEQLERTKLRRSRLIGTGRHQLLDQQRQIREAQNLPRIGCPPFQQAGKNMEDMEEMPIDSPQIQREHGRQHAYLEFLL